MAKITGNVSEDEDINDFYFNSIKAKLAILENK